MGNIITYDNVINKYLLVSLIVTLAIGCSNGPLEGFTKVSPLVVKDTIELENRNILNPHHIFYKNDFLIFNSIGGKREIQLLNLSTNDVTEYRVIGHGKDEMINYCTMNSTDEEFYKFVDIHLGKVYGVNLDSLKENSQKQYELLYSLPIANGYHFFRFMELSHSFVGIGMIKQGRFGIYEKGTNIFKEEAEYPENEDINNLDYRYKGALFSSALMVSDSMGKRMATSCFGLIDFYSVSEQGKISLIKSNHYHFPLFKIGTNGPAISYKKEDKVGIYSLCADDNYVYALYSDKTMAEYGENAYDASVLLVWDWNGNPIKAYELSATLYGFAIDGNIVYGLSREEFPIVYVFEMNHE